MKPPAEDVLRAVCTNLPGWGSDIPSIAIGTAVGLVLGAVIVFGVYRLMWRDKKDEPPAPVPDNLTDFATHVPRHPRR